MINNALTVPNSIVHRKICGQVIGALSPVKYLMTARVLMPIALQLTLPITAAASLGQAQQIQARLQIDRQLARRGREHRQGVLSLVGRSRQLQHHTILYIYVRVYLCQRSSNLQCPNKMTPKIYSANCHCNAVRYKVTLEDALAPEGTTKVNRCNCSICTKYGAFLHNQSTETQFPQTRIICTPPATTTLTFQPKPTKPHRLSPRLSQARRCPLPRRLRNRVEAVFLRTKAQTAFVLWRVQQ
jgi:hypothetical protein